MKFFRPLMLLLAGSTLLSCENEVEINADFEEVTAVYALLEATADTQFVKINKTFLDDNLSAVQLAGTPESYVYDSLTVSMEEYTVTTNSSGVRSPGNLLKEFTLGKTTVPKEDGLFSQERNEVYFTTERISSSRFYILKVVKPDGSITRGRVNPTNGIQLNRPNLGARGSIALVNPRDQIQTYTFEFQTGLNIGEFSANLTFTYFERDNNDDTTYHSFSFPLIRFENPDLEAGEEFEFEYDGNNFFEIFENEIPASPNSPFREIPDNAFTLEINSADADYYLYREINGPIDGLSQTRPEFTNVENGIGLFASRYQNVIAVNMDGTTKNYIENVYGNKDNNLAGYRGFDPR